MEKLRKIDLKKAKREQLREKKELAVTKQSSLLEKPIKVDVPLRRL